MSVALKNSVYDDGKNQFHVLELGAHDYPQSIFQTLGQKSPKKLYAIGNLSLLKIPSIGFCGARKVSDKGIAAAQDCAIQAVEKGLVIVSGNAAGVDRMVHKTALINGGQTIFVLPEGINKANFVRELKDIWDWDRVLVVSEFEPDHTWQAFRAMKRNGTIIGLSDAMVVIEAGEKGGTINAGRQALAAKAPLFALVYGADDEGPGNKILIGEGAKPIKRKKTNGRANLDAIFEVVFNPSSRPKEESTLF